MAREMKNSGIAWIGEIPEGWNVLRLKSLFSFGKGLPITKENLEDTGVPVISYGQIHSKTNTGVKLQDDLFRFVSPSYIERNAESLVHSGDIIVADTSEDTDGCGNCVHVDREMQLFAGYHTIILKALEQDDNKYLAYQMKTDPWRSQIRSRVSGVKVFSISRKILSDSLVVFPPLSEQSRIAAYLDYHCAEIDRIMEQTRVTIEEYKKLKQSIITEAVTHGVRGPRKMKDSGVEWIGEIPDEWNCKPIKYVAIFQPACVVSNLTEDSEITYMPMDCLKNGYYVENSSRYGLLASSLTQFEEGDIAMAKVTPCFENGNIAIMEGLHSGFGMGSSELFIYRPYAVLAKYLLYWLQNDLFKQSACATMTGTGGLKRVSPYFAKHSHIAVPDQLEQQQIIDYLAFICGEVDRLIDSKQQLLTELEAYKKSVIYEYVTGKREVPQ
ncbi:MAG: restriction endonuclease subunit S [Firmicutes bacterium]|nr:restriction endonuclease subunit S [Clostridia bacterium]MBO6158821.1 restriction endonuclease subunit S [Bacillota bacterium]